MKPQDGSFACHEVIYMLKIRHNLAFALPLAAEECDAGGHRKRGARPAALACLRELSCAHGNTALGNSVFMLNIHEIFQVCLS